MACFEIKLEQLAARLAESLMNEYVRTVWCSYDYDIFNNCILTEYRGHFFHQASVATFNYGNFVTAKAEEEVVNITQIVIVKFLQADINE